MSIDLDGSQADAALQAAEAELMAASHLAESAEAVRQRLEHSSEDRRVRWAQAGSEWRALRHALAERVAGRRRQVRRQRAGLWALVAALPGALVSWAVAAVWDRLLALPRRVAAGFRWAGLLVSRAADSIRLALGAAVDALRRFLRRILHQ